MTVHSCGRPVATCRWCEALWCPRCDGLTAGHGCEESRDPGRERLVSDYGLDGTE